MAGQNGKRIMVEKTLHHKDAFVQFMGYTSFKRPVLMEIISFPVTGRSKSVKRISEDNGKTWTVVGDAGWEEKRGDRIARRGTAALHLFADANILVEFLCEQESRLNEEMSFGPEAETQEHLELRTGRIFYRFSRDEGKSWGEVKQLIQKGRGYDPVHWAEGVWHGKNGCTPTGLTQPIRISDGALLLPVYLWRADEKGALIKWPDRFGTVVWPVPAAACFRGEWNASQGDFEWEISSQITVPEYISHGMDESEIAEVEDGKLMIVIRGCTAGWQSFSGVKFFAISKDGGRTWGPAVPLTYPDGSFVHSPACLPNFFRSSKNNRLYIIANILPEPCRQSDPRYPLKIAEIDPKYFWVLPETETVIEDRQARHGKLIRFSNWQRIEDRETGNPVIYMTEGRADTLIPDPEEAPIIPDSYRYEIKLPE